MRRRGIFNGLDGWEKIADFAKYKRDFFEKYLDLSKGFPSDDTLRRFFEALDSKAFRTRFMEWASSFVPKTEDKTVCIDGKRIRTASNMVENPLHIVSAWVSENQMTLTQTVMPDKSNEITAIPQLLEIFDLRKAIVTIDAMGCQTEIARKNQGGRCGLHPRCPPMCATSSPRTNLTARRKWRSASANTGVSRACAGSWMSSSTRTTV